MMNDRELITALRRLRVQTGSITCMGCGYEHNCGIHGCLIVREAGKRLEELTGAGSQRVMEYRGDGQKS